MLTLKTGTAEKVADRIMNAKRQSFAGDVHIWVYNSKTTGGIVVYHDATEKTPYRVMVGETDIVPNPPAQVGTGSTVREALIAALTQE